MLGLTAILNNIFPVSIKSNSNKLKNYELKENSIENDNPSYYLIIIGIILILSGMFLNAFEAILEENLLQNLDLHPYTIGHFFIFFIWVILMILYFFIH
jgi:uncharacterized membrane protein